MAPANNNAAASNHRSRSAGDRCRAPAVDPAHARTSQFCFSRTGAVIAMAIIGRDERERQDKRGGERNDHRERHRLEHLALDAAEREQRHIDQHDDGLAIDGRLDHFLRGDRHRFEALVERERSAPMRAAAPPDAAGCSRQ